MAYNIYQEPHLFSPAYNEQVYVVHSSNSGQTNFNYIADLYINSKVFRLKATANPTYGSGVFNFGRVIESYVSSDISKDNYGFQQNTNSHASYYVKFGEEYGSSSGVTSYPNLRTSTTKYVWNGVLDFLDYQAYSPDHYLADGGETFNRNIDRDIELTQQAWFYFGSNDTTNYDKAIVNAYNSAGALIRGVEIANLYTSSGTVANHFLRCSSGPANLNLVSSGVITNTLGSGSVIPSNTSYYTFQFDGAGASPIYRFNISSPCKYPTYRLHFLNELGAFESFNFTKVSRTDIDISRGKYKAPYGSLTSANTWGYNKSDRQERVYHTAMKTGLKLKSDWLSEDEHDWLQELVASPEIYLDDDTHGLVAVTCNVSKIDVKTSLNDKLFNLEIDLEYSFARYRQRY